MNRVLDIIVWAIMLVLFIIAFVMAAGCAGCTPLEGSYSTIKHDDFWRARQDQDDPFMQFLGHIAEGSFHGQQDHP